MVEDERAQMRRLLLANVGFDEPEAWIDFALAHHFHRVPATQLWECPECGSSEGVTLGQYVYYSSLARLKRCNTCDLIYSDVRIPREVVSEHFERTYKEEDYFQEQRRAIFEDVAAVAARLAPTGGAVLDMGGALGHLLARLGTIRPDLRLVLNDLSMKACEGARRSFGLETIEGGLADLCRSAGQFDVLILSDVLYYEPEIKLFWKALPKLLRPGGSIIIRVPNKLALIALSQRLRRDEANQTSVPFFNPEHIYILSRAYLGRHIREAGFRSTSFLPSPPLDSDRMLTRLYFGLARMIGRATGGRLVITPSTLVVGEGLHTRH